MATRVADENMQPTISSDASIPKSTPNFCRRDSPEVVRWIDDHAPHTTDSQAKEASVGLSSVSVLPTPGESSDQSIGLNSLERTDIVDGSTPISSSAQLAAFTEAHTITYVRTLVCNAPKAMLWRAMMRSIKAPPCCNVKNVAVKCEGLDYVYREMDVRVDHEQDEWMRVKEKVTWDESDCAIRSTLYEDEVKEGYIEKAITSDASAHTCLTISCNWAFKPRPELTPESLAKYRKQIRNALDVACANTVKTVEEEARELALERRKRHHSLTKETPVVIPPSSQQRESSKNSPRQQ